jgi:hypothetical protein
MYVCMCVRIYACMHAHLPTHAHAPCAPPRCASGDQSPSEMSTAACNRRVPYRYTQAQVTAIITPHTPVFFLCVGWNKHHLLCISRERDRESEGRRARGSERKREGVREKERERERERVHAHLNTSDGTR